MFMTNIPRRKIYEEMLIYEDGLIEIEILISTKKKIEDNIEFLDNIFNQIEKSYFKIKALFILFLENKKFETDEKLNKELEKLVSQNLKINEILFENKNLNNDFKNSIKEIDKLFENKKNENDLKEIFKKLDKFNHLIPDLLTIRRDKMN